MRHTYYLEVVAPNLTTDPDGWYRLREVTLEYGRGFLDAIRGAAGSTVHYKWRVTRDDGKVAASLADNPGNIGATAGMPTAEDYEEAAQRFIAKAAALRACGVVRT